MKLNKYYNKITNIYEDLDDVIGMLEEKRDAIEDRAMEHDRDMSDAEQERYDAIDEQIENIRMAMDELEGALSYIEEYSEC